MVARTLSIDERGVCPEHLGEPFRQIVMGTIFPHCRNDYGLANVFMLELLWMISKWQKKLMLTAVVSLCAVAVAVALVRPTNLKPAPPTGTSDGIVHLQTDPKGKEKKAVNSLSKFELLSESEKYLLCRRLGSFASSEKDEKIISLYRKRKMSELDVVTALNEQSSMAGLALVNEIFMKTKDKSVKFLAARSLRKAELSKSRKF